MPYLYDKIVDGLKSKYGESRAHAIATARMQKLGYFKKGTRELTAKGKRRNALAMAMKK